MNKHLPLSVQDNSISHGNKVLNFKRDGSMHKCTNLLTDHASIELCGQQKGDVHV